MKKNLSLLIALALSLTINTAVFADAANSAVPNNTNVINTSSDTITLTLDDALNNVEKNNTELKLLNDKINSLNKQYDINHNDLINLNVSSKDPGYLGVKLKEIISLGDDLSIKDAKNTRDNRLNAIKIDMQRQYMNVLNSRDQIDNINKTLANINEKIGQLQEKIKVGQAASNELDTLNVQKSQLEAEKNTIQDSIDQSLLKMKQYLNIDLNKTLNLVSTKKAFVKFDDKDISNRISSAVSKDYSLVLLKEAIDINVKANDVYTKYTHNYLPDPSSLLQAMIKKNGGKTSYVADETSYKSKMASAQTQLASVKAGLPQALWGNYYALKNKEDSVQTQILTEKTAQDTYDKLKKNFEVGMIDKVTVDSAALELDKQKNLTERAINEYMVAQDEFNYMLQGHASNYKSMSTQSMGAPGIGY